MHRLIGQHSDRQHHQAWQNLPIIKYCVCHVTSYLSAKVKELPETLGLIEQPDPELLAQCSDRTEV
jgi:hypothetical protein